MSAPRRVWLAPTLLGALFAAGCDDGGAGIEGDAAKADAAIRSDLGEAQPDAHPRQDLEINRDSGAADAGMPDAARPDAAPIDATPPDAAAPELDAQPDAELDAALPDAELPDAELPWPVLINEVACQGTDGVELVGPPGLALAGLVFGDSDPTHRFALPEDAALDDAGFYWVARGAGGFDFGLACDEAVGLYSAAGTTVDALTLPGEGEAPALPEGASYGRLPDAEGAFAPNTPTPGAANTAFVPPVPPLFVPGAVVTAEIELPPGARGALERDPRRTVPASLKLTLPSGEVVGPLGVGVHLKGRAGSFRDLNGKPAFKVDVNFQDPAARVFGMKSLTFNNAVQDPSFLHEHTAYALLRAANLPAPRTGNAWVSLDGEPQGLYVTVETWDNVALARWFDGTRLLVEGAYGQDLFADGVFDLDVDEGAGGEVLALFEIAEVLADPPAEGAYAALADRVDWDEVLGVMAGEILFGHWDGYAWTRNNWFMHLDAEGRLALLPWGVDQTFNDFLPLHEGQGLLLNACLADPDCTIRYDHAIGRILDAWDTLDLAGDAARIATDVNPWAQRDPRREYSMDDVRGWQAWLPEYLQQRRAQVGEEIACLLGDNPDPDGDGYRCATDCAPDDPDVHPGAEEICGDGIDQDCSGAPDDDPRCPDCVTRPVMGQNLLFCPTPRTFAEAEARCTERGRTLVRIDNAAFSDAVQAAAIAVRYQSWWIGLDDRAVEGRFRWADGTDPTFTVWAGGEPNNAGNEDCAHYWPDRAEWNDSPCETRMGTICAAFRP